MNVIGSYKEAVITNIYLCYSYTVILYEEVKQASVAKISYLDISEREIYNAHVRTHITQFSSFKAFNVGFKQRLL